MKIPGSLIQAMAIGVTVSIVAVSCHQNDANSAVTKKDKKEQRGKNGPANCPACGMG